MKVRNKKTGEIGNLVLNINPNRESFTVVSTKNGDTLCGNAVIGDYDSLAELNAEWEDYEEPKEWWFIDSGGEVVETTYITDYDKTNLRNFGNRFETKEEAEKVAEKIQAWQRLNDKGIRFLGYDRYSDGHWHIMFTFDNYCSGEPHSASDDLDLLFGGE